MKKALKTISAALALLALTAPIHAAGYIKFDGVDGECKDDGHKNWINLLSVSQPIHRAGGSAARPGTSGPGSLTMAVQTDKATPKLLEAATKGKVFSKVVIEAPLANRSSRATYYRYELTNVRVSSYQTGGSAAGNTVPMEQISLNYEKIKVSYGKDGAKKGNVETTWKVEEGESAAPQRPSLRRPSTPQRPTVQRLNAQQVKGARLQHR